MSQQQSLISRLKSCSDLWVRDNDSTLAALGRRAVNDSSFFVGLDARVKGPSVDTIERFARFLVDPANWPERQDGGLPVEVQDFAHAVGVSASPRSAATGPDGETSGRAAAA